MMKILISLSVLFLVACGTSQKNAESAKVKATQSSPKKIKKALVPGKMADFVQKVLPAGWEENYEFERGDTTFNYMQMTYKNSANVDFFMFSADKKDYLVRVDWDCKTGDCSEGLSAYKMEKGSVEEIKFASLLSKKLKKRMSQKVSYCVGPKFQFGSMWAETTCELGFEFSKLGGDNTIYKSGVTSKGLFKGEKSTTMKWNSKTAVFD